MATPIIKSIHIEKFRAFKDKDIKFTNNIVAIAGQNGTMKTTLLGMLSQPFSMQTHEAMQNELTIDNQPFEKKFQDVFKISKQFDVIGEHDYTLTLDKRIYDEEEYHCVSIKRSENKRKSLRFWNADGREKGKGFIQCPVIFLSLKRLLPIGETKAKEAILSDISESEKVQFISLHNSILSLDENINEVESVTSKNEKNTLGVKTDYYDAMTISAGQDNVGKIILALLSFQRLKEKYPDDYQGGLLFIDEIESTLYPSAQKKLLENLKNFARELKLQIFFTTHSYSILEEICDDPALGNIVYLTRTGKNIEVHYPKSMYLIQCDLEVKAASSCPNTKILRIFTEDAEARIWLKHILRDVEKYFIFESCTFAYFNYQQMYKHKFPDITKNIVVLDGDVPENQKNRIPNFLRLPGDTSPERFFATFLRQLDEEDEFWNNCLGGYNKQVCFRDIPNSDDREKYKSWFNSQLTPNAWGKNGQKLFRRWEKDNDKTIQDFKDKFFKIVKKLTGVDLRKIQE